MPVCDTISSWEEFLTWTKRFEPEEKQPNEDRTQPRWVFRGEPGDYGLLKTSLDREAEDRGIARKDLWLTEWRLMHEFRRRLHHYTQYVPHPLDYAELLALMQHHGGPTRLLDWTYSPFVAAYFAIEAAKLKPCVIYALEASDLRGEAILKRFSHLSGDIRDVYRRARKRCPLPPETDARDPDLYKLGVFLFHKPQRCVLAATPYRLNERLTVQQGVLLMPGDISVSFPDNLFAMGKPVPLRMKIVVDETRRTEFIRQLFRMNITRATLFPGLDGYAWSLRTRLTIPETLSSAKPPSVP